MAICYQQTVVKQPEGHNKISFDIDLAQYNIALVPSHKCLNALEKYPSMHR